MFSQLSQWIRLLSLTAFCISSRLAYAADEPKGGADPKPAAEPAAAGQGAVFADFDSDGYVDFLVSNLYQSGPKQPQPFGEYWIGIDGVPPDDALRAQLELPAGQGLLINQVVQDSPAAKAGLKQYDLLLSCQDQPLSGIADLAKIIDEKKETLLALRLIRGGKRIIIEITPQRRPASQTGETCPAVSKVDDATYMRRVWLDLLGALPEADDVHKFVGDKQSDKRVSLVNRLLRKSMVASKSCAACHADEGKDWKLSRNLVTWAADVSKFDDVTTNAYIKRLVGLPGAYVSVGDGIFVEAGSKLPDDVSVTVTIKGSESAKVTVKKGDQTWEAAGAEIQTKLPAEVRGHVAALFTSTPIASGKSLLWTPGDPHREWDVLLKGRVDWSNDAWPDVYIASPANVNVQPPASESAFDRLDKQIDSLGTQLGELRKAMHDLQQSLKTEKRKSPASDK
jgi:prefoldin subunit 5